VCTSTHIPHPVLRFYLSISIKILVQYVRKLFGICGVFNKKYLALFTQFINSFRFFCIYTTTNHNTDCSGKINFAAVRNYLNFCEENNRPKLSSSLKTIEIQAVKNKKLKQRKKNWK